MKKEKDREKDKEKKKKRLKKSSKNAQKSAIVQAAIETAAALNTKSTQRPLEYFLHCVGGKWKMRILWALKEEKSLRYRLIRSKVADITDMMLSQSLRELTECGLTIRHQFQEIPPRVEYEITDAGRELLPLFEKLIQWEDKFRPVLENTESLPDKT